MKSLIVLAGVFALTLSGAANAELFRGAQLSDAELAQWRGGATPFLDGIFNTGEDGTINGIGNSGTGNEGVGNTGTNNTGVLNSGDGNTCGDVPSSLYAPSLDEYGTPGASEYSVCSYRLRCRDQVDWKCR